jgi:hypothetical protein
MIGFTEVILNREKNPGGNAIFAVFLAGTVFPSYYFFPMKVFLSRKMPSVTSKVIFCRSLLFYILSMKKIQTREDSPLICSFKQI